MGDAGIRMVKNDPNNAKIYLVGHKGWIGSMYLEELEKKNINCEHSDLRAETEEIKIDIIEKNITHVVCCMGRTHGTFQEKKYTTIDYLENKETLPINLNDNLYAPLSLALFCDKNDIHFTYIGTGCIYEYDKEHGIESGNGFKEDDKPNFFGSNYSIVKGFTNNLMKQTNALHLRIRMPITGSQNPRNFITKITTYEKICSIQNSMSVLDELIPLSVRMMINKETGTFNFTNPGSISHNEILEMYRDIVDPYFTWKNFTIEEQDEILLGKRSNNLLDTTLLENRYQITNIKESVQNCLTIMKENNTKLKENNKSTFQLLEDFLLEQCKKIKESGETIQNSDKNDKVAVIIEPRNHKLLEPVVRNVMHHLGKEWNLHIFGHDLAYIRSSFPKSNITFTGLTSNNLTPEEHNKLLRNLDFWNAIKQEHILIFQTDSFIMNKIPDLDKYLEYPFIGGVYKSYIFENKQVNGWDERGAIQLTDTPKQDFSINGNFSLRKKSAMVDCLHKINEDLIKSYKKNNSKFPEIMEEFMKNEQAEDFYFHHALEFLNYNLPSLEECNKFCNNLYYPTLNKEAFAIRNIDKDYVFQDNRFRSEIDNILSKLKNNTIETPKQWYNNKGIKIKNPNDRLNAFHKKLNIKYGDIKGEDVEQSLMLKYIENDDIVLELGGNIGRVSCLIASIIADDKNLLTFECNPKHYKEILENRNNNHFEFNIEDKAISENKLYQFGWNTFTEYERSKYNKKDQDLMFEIKTITLSEIKKKYNLNFNTLVMDCEGAFYYIIQSFPEIMKGIKKIIVENDYPTWERKKFVDNIFKNEGFTLVESISLGKKNWIHWKDQNIRDNFYQVFIKNTK